MKVTLVMAMTLEGKTGKIPDHLPDWTAPEDKVLIAKSSKAAGVVVMGSKMFATISAPLSERLNIVLSRDKKRGSPWDNLKYTSDPPAKILSDLEVEGCSQVILAGGSLVNSLFAEEQLVDEIIVTISPKIFGFGVSLFGEEINMNLRFVDLSWIGENLFA